MNFKKPKDTLKFIEIWGWMDDVVHQTKKREAVKMWEKSAVPHKKEGKVFTVCYGSFWNTDMSGTRLRPIKYEDVIVNRYDMERQFKGDSYQRIYSLFTEVMAM